MEENESYRNETYGINLSDSRDTNKVPMQIKFEKLPIIAGCQKGMVITMELNYTDGPEIPLGLGMALAQNLNAMNYFASLDNTGKQQVIDGTHSVRSKSEMKQYVSNLTEGNSFR